MPAVAILLPPQLLLLVLWPHAWCRSFPRLPLLCVLPYSACCSHHLFRTHLQICENVCDSVNHGLRVGRREAEAQAHPL